MQWTNSLSKEQYEAINYYTGAGYDNINDSLRGFSSFATGNYERAVNIHRALSKAYIPKRCTVYRGASAQALGALKNLRDEELVGAHVVDLGFMSTSLDRDDAFYGEVNFVIDVPAGAHGAYVGYLSQLGHYEKEVLFDYRQQLLITKVERDNNGNRIINAKMM